MGGTAYHNAGLPPEDRKIVEQTFLGGHIRVLCATSTLAMGVNLPAHLVVIKGTKVWRGAGVGMVDLDTGTLMQMMGRAGRPGFDTKGVAVIMTDNESAKDFGQRIKGSEIIESQLQLKLVETLNAEISQGVITSSADALLWMRGTFFYVRVKKNPATYKLQPGQTDTAVDKVLEKMCWAGLRELSMAKIVNMDKTGEVRPLPPCAIMSVNMVSDEHRAVRTCLSFFLSRD